MANQKTAPIAVVLVVAIACLAVVTAAVLSDQQAKSAGGSVIATDDIEVYNDQGATDPCMQIDWGTIDEGSSATHTIYVKNTGGSTQTLHLSMSNWVPSEASSFLSVSWDREAASLLPGEMVLATLRLSAAWDTGSLDVFSFDLTVEGI